MARTKRERRVTIEDVAAASGVSIMTVSRALRGVEGVSQRKRAEILKAASTLGYQPSSVAGALATANSNLIGISVPTLFEVVFAEIFDGMLAAFEKAGFQTVLDTSEYDPLREERFVARMVSWRPAGIILTGGDHSAGTLSLLARSRTPTLEIWDFVDDPVDLCVGIDHRAAGLAMGRHLVGLGYRTPAYVGVERGRDGRAEARLEGFVDAFRAVGADLPPEARSMMPDTSFTSGQAGLDELLGRGIAPDVVYFLNDHLAVGGLLECNRRGIDVPGAMGIAGFNALNIAHVLPIRLTTSATPRREMGAAGARLLVARIQGAKTTSVVEMPVRLEPGATTRQRTLSKP